MMISYENLSLGILHILTKNQLAKLPIVVGFLYFTLELRIPKLSVLQATFFLRLLCKKQI